MADNRKIVVSVNDIHKEFILPQSKNTSFKQTFVNIVKNNNKVTQKVLDGVSFKVYEGDFFGIVGRNGSGKSTLLKLLAGVYTPTSGEITINGQLTPFIELGVGFNPELSGRDNVFLNGALLGFDRKQMNEMYDDIVEFAELEPFMDQKLKNYSSGMQVRLAFSIAIKAKNDLLIFDEVLAVGDEAFQRKCLDVFERYKAEGQTVILVTHEMATVKKYCNRAILISEGKLVEEGDPRRVADHYSELNQQSIDKETSDRNARTNSKKAKLTLKDTKTDSVKNSYQVGESMTVEVKLDDLKVELESVGIDIFKETGEHVTGINSRYSKLSLKNKSVFNLDLNLSIAPGRYYTSLNVFDIDSKPIVNIYDGPKFTVIDKKNLVDWSGLVKLKGEWR